jgi:WhiB family redox-sensing transcriptional regulator
MATAVRPPVVSDPGGSVRPDVSWTDRAACRDEDPELFFPISATGPGRAQAAEATAVCARCPVRGECLEYALTTGQEAGIWGGLTEEERRARGRARGRAR